jgi:two-component system, NtrC family, nitrogen regulation sensor histidine kinase NtrY
MRLLKKYIWLVLSVFSFTIATLFYAHFFSANFSREAAQVQKKVEEFQKEIAKLNSALIQEITYLSSEEIWKNFTNRFADSDVNIHILRNDTLIFWNNNIPLNSFQLVEDGFNFNNFGNGYYLSHKESDREFSVFTSRLIQTNFSYQNKYLFNDFSSAIGNNLDIRISTEPCDGCIQVYSCEKGEILFYLASDKEIVEVNHNAELIVYILYCLGLIFLACGLASFVRLSSKEAGIQSRLLIWIALIIGIVLVVVLFWNLIPIHEFYLFNPLLYASSDFLPSFGHLIYYIIVLMILIWWLYKFPIKPIKSQLNKWLLYTLFIVLFPLAFIFTTIFQSLIVNSTIYLELDRLFSLNGYSVIAILAIGLMLLAYYLIAHWVIVRLRCYHLRLTVLIWFLGTVASFLYEVFAADSYLINALFPGTVIGIILLVSKYEYKRYNFLFQTFLLAFFAFISALNIYEYNHLNELQKRALFAHQLVSDKDAATEAEFLEVNEKLKTSNLIDRYENLLIEEAYLDRFPELFEECCLDRFWERYDLTFFLFQNEHNIYPQISVPGASKRELNKIVEQHGMRSEFSDELFHVYDNFERLSYIARVKQDDWTLFIKIQSKRIPEQIGFPRILINQSAFVIDELEEYSIARYYGGKLVMRYGVFNYPLLKNKLTENWTVDHGYHVGDGINHFVYTDNDNQTIVISKPSKTWLENITIFSYLFIFFGALLILFNLLFLRTIIKYSSLNLSLKIQLVMIAVLIVSFLVFGIATGSFVKNQYHSFTFENIQERLYSVEIEVKQKLGENNEIDRITTGAYLDYILKKFAHVFATDINIYDKSGNLLATSQPRLYSRGITGLQMNSVAFNQLKYKRSSEFIHQESIGELDYLSAYIPLLNNEGALLGYLNLQHFAKQNVYESQLSGFIVAIINIAVLFLVFSVIIALLVSNWLTAPLRLIQQSIRTIELGKQNKPINYSGNDELGALVKEYNLKLEELELKAMQLARSERESAWREMAKQVAHEIKNPLTPMKLSLQHFQRSFNPEDPQAKEKIDRISASLVEQINTLTGIANEFSNFAKMPQPNEETINLVDLIRNVVEIFNSEADGIVFTSKEEEVLVFADKDLMVRAFNNLLKNAIQSIPEDRSPDIRINVSRDENFVLAQVQDNGIGIDEDKRSKIFVPNFTTKTTGAGLGLAMVRQIIENHHGEIWFESEPGIGTSFFVRIPLKQED